MMALGFLLAELMIESVPYRDLRYEEVVGQAEWYTCGPAAVATVPAAASPPWGPRLCAPFRGSWGLTRGGSDPIK
ncbi:hypothetical protein H5T53_04010 [Candidatus Bipolaricaulota bacterium]|nr:hypothetical protein [Candidatus Bipolaricaulota bacterium]